MNHVILTLVLYAFWMLLAGCSDRVSMIIGALASILVAALWRRHFKGNMRKALDLRRWFWAFLFLFVFIWEMTKANFDVAYRVLHPKRPLAPGIIRVSSRIQSLWGRVFLANAITLTPGTLTVDLCGADLYVHCIRIKPDNLDHIRNQIVLRFDRYLTKIFD